MDKKELVRKGISELEYNLELPGMTVETVVTTDHAPREDGGVGKPTGEYVWTMTVVCSFDPEEYPYCDQD